MKKTAILVALCAMPFAAQANLIFNGNFALGNVGFTSDYNFITYGTGDFGVAPGAPANGYGPPLSMYDEGTYTITNVQPGAWHQSWRNDVDLTGHGYYMLLNGATSGGGAAWKQAVTLSHGVSYTLSFDVFTAYEFDSALASLQLTLGNHLIGSVLAPSGTQGWETLSVTFTYDSSWATSPNYASILNIQNEAHGNDYGIDNISLTANPVPEPFTMVLGAMGIGAYIRKRRSTKG